MCISNLTRQHFNCTYSIIYIHMVPTVLYNELLMLIESRQPARYNTTRIGVHSKYSLVVYRLVIILSGSTLLVLNCSLYRGAGTHNLSRLHVFQYAWRHPCLHFHGLVDPSECRVQRQWSYSVCITFFDRLSNDRYSRIVCLAFSI